MTYNIYFFAGDFSRPHPKPPLADQKISKGPTEPPQLVIHSLTSGSARPLGSSQNVIPNLQAPPPRSRASSVISDSAGQPFAREVEVTAKAVNLIARRVAQQDQTHRSQTPRSHCQSRTHVAFAHATARSNVSLRHQYFISLIQNLVHPSI